MESFKKIQEILSPANFPSENYLFDEDFRELLEIYYFLGFYRPKRSISRDIYGIISFLLVVLSFLLGMIKEALESIYQGHLQRSLFCVASMCLNISIPTQIITFVVNEFAIIEMIKAIQSIHDEQDEKALEYYRKKCRQLVKFYKVYCNIALVFLVSLYLCGYKIFMFLLPAIYDNFAEGWLFYPLLITNILQIYFIALCLLVSDLIHILCMIRTGAYFGILSERLRRCTDSDELSENEKKLNACVKYHQRIIE